MAPQTIRTGPGPEHMSGWSGGKMTRPLDKSYGKLEINLW
jgi:hypothetical protein